MRDFPGLGGVTDAIRAQVRDLDAAPPRPRLRGREDDRSAPPQHPGDPLPQSGRR